MKQFLFSLMVTVFAFSFSASEAEAAKRFGGGSSFGMQRQITPPTAPRTATQAPKPTGQAAAATGGRSWMGPIAGLAAGLGLAALFSHLGLGEEFGSFMLIALLLFAGVMLFRMFARRASGHQSANSMQYAAQGAGAHATARPLDPAYDATSPAPSAALRSDFDEEGFVRQAKRNFIRLQAANDEGNLADIREFTTPEVFAEIRLQHEDSAGDSTRRTDVIELDAQVLEVAEEDTRYVVSVRFWGVLREELDAAPLPFDEIWHLVKEREGTRGWLVGGIQQTS